MWARIEVDKVAEITDIDPDGRFHSDLIWVTANINVSVGDLYTNGEFSKPQSIIHDRDARTDRLIAYKAESDPLKIEAEYNAMISGNPPDYSKWAEKVAEIKLRYPIL